MTDRDLSVGNWSLDDSTSKANFLNGLRGAGDTLQGTLQRLGGRRFNVRLLTTPDDIIQALALRFNLFHRKPPQPFADGAFSHDELDHDIFDSYALHLVVTPDQDHGRILGYMRLVLEEDAVDHQGFYSASEFDLQGIIGRDFRLIEIGRLFTLDGQSQPMVSRLLFQGMLAVASVTGRRVVFGCGSFSGTDAAVHHAALSWVTHYCTLSGDHCPVVQPSCRLDLDPLPFHEVAKIPRKSLNLPSPLAFYLDNGALVADGVAVDPIIGTLDVLVMMSFANLRRSVAMYAGLVARDLMGLDTVNAPKWQPVALPAREKNSSG